MIFRRKLCGVRGSAGIIVLGMHYGDREPLTFKAMRKETSARNYLSTSEGTSFRVVLDREKD